jgi:predicted metal-dependent hydrolase
VRGNGRSVVRTVRVGARRLTYSLRFDEAPRLVISVYPDLTVSVRAPRGANPLQVDARVVRRAAWIHRQLLAFERYHPLPVPRRYVGGETHRYLGRQYRLRIRRGPEAVRLSGPFLYVWTRDASPRTVSRLVQQWYRDRAGVAFPRRVRAILRAAPWLAPHEPRFRLAFLTRSWGSCGRTGMITLNIDLMKAPTSCIDYVIAHELSHLSERRHSRRFYSLMRRAVPDWERLRDRLNQGVR